MRFPVNALDVIVHFRSQLDAAPCAAGLEHFPPVTSLHPLAESMYAQTTALFGLISTLWHFDLFI
jgi:hypothetical protein